MYLCIECFNHTKDAYVSLCGHHYCKHCRNKFKLSCVACGKVLIFQGNQPAGHMTWRTDTEHSLPGHEDCGTIVLGFNFDRGIQGIAVQLSLLLYFMPPISGVVYFYCRSGASQPGGTLLVLILYRLPPWQRGRAGIVQRTEKGVWWKIVIYHWRGQYRRI